MDRLKFRAWDGSKMNYDFIVYRPQFVDLLRIMQYEEFAVKTYNSISEWKIMQFIGLLDKNGQEIYEGDFIEIENYNGQIITTSFSCNLLSGLTFDNSTLTFDMGLYDWTPNLSECIVVGNIYQNPELLQNGSNKEND